MQRLVFLLVAMTALAGCSDDSESNTPTCDEESEYLDETTGACVAHTEPTVHLTGLPASVEQYQTVSFTYTLDNGTRTGVHSMDSRIMASLSNDPVTNATGPDDWGTQISRQEHKDLPGEFEGEFSWDEPGTVYVKGYMEINAENIWVDLAAIDVAAVTASGNYTDVTISGDGAPALSESNIGVTVGDGVRFVNDAAFEYTLEFITEGCPSGGAIPSGESLEVDFLDLGSCDFHLNSPLGAVDAENDPGHLEGQVNVNKP